MVFTSMVSQVFCPELYPKILHEMLNVTGRMQSVASLLRPEENPSADDIALARKIIARDSEKLNGSLRLFCLLHWLDAGPELQQNTVDLSLLLQEAVGVYITDESTPITLGIRGEACNIQTCADVITPLVSELVKNAVTHRAPNTAIEVNGCFEDDIRRIEVINTSRTPLPENYAQALIKYPESPGMGLGLTFAFKAAEALGGNLDLSHKGDLFKAVFTLPA